jgi:hypothetical protein
MGDEGGWIQHGISNSEGDTQEQHKGNPEKFVMRVGLTLHCLQFVKTRR